MGNRLKLEGQRFGKLMVITFSHISTGKRKNTFWNCLCDCGKTRTVMGSHLTSGGNKTCGDISHKIGTNSSRFKDLMGQKFGKLRVISSNFKRANNSRLLWKCLCDCGKTKMTQGHYLITGDTKSCGCLQHRKDTQSPLWKGLIGQKFNNITVLEYSHRTPSGNTQYKCKCDCGSVFITAGGNLSGGHTTSCGCAKRGHGEELVRAILEKRTSKKWITVRKVLGGLELDCYNEEFKAAVEYNGQQHYEYISKFFHPTKRHFLEQQKRDAKKVKLCSTKGIKLLVLLYLPNFNPKTIKQMESKIVNFLRENKILTKGD